MRKTTISVPAGLLAAIDRMARQRGESRSQFVQGLLVEAVSARDDVEFTNMLNDFFAGTANRAAHREESKVWAQPRPAWNDERW
jgi:metal-responsive CopG/Arc/MetJ family transcriptional regulator